MKSSLIVPRRPSGFNEFLPSEQIEFNRLRDIVRSTYEKYGYSPIDTPDVELSDVLLAKGGGETEKQVYRFTRGKNDLSLRFDLTVPLARYVAEHEGQLIFPFRCYQIGKVHRAERAQAGRFREFYQCDIDVIGSESSMIDAELPAVINDIFEQFCIGEFTIRINNRMILNGLFEKLGLAQVSTEILRVIDNVEKVTHEAFMTELQRNGLSDEQIARVLAFMNVRGTNDEVLDWLERQSDGSDMLARGVTKLRELVTTLRIMGVPEARFKIDIRIARGLDYYTGTVYETVLDDYPSIGSVCSGGRYDDLASYYTKTPLMGVGISIGLSRLFYKLVEVGAIVPRRQSMARVMVVPLDDESVTQALESASCLRASGVSTIVNTEPGSIKKKFRYADRIGCQYVITIGDRERANGTLSVKCMVSGESHESSVADCVKFISHRLMHD